MAQPITIQFGPWAPDLANVATQLPFYPTAITPVPCSDAYNVYYQDGAYRSLPSPSAIGGTTGFQVLNAFTWYDNASGNEMVFAAGVGGISDLISGTWTSVPIGGNSPSSFGIQLTMGAMGAFVGITQSTLTVGNSFPDYGFLAGSYGSFSPATDLYGNTVTGLWWSAHHPPPANVTVLTYGTASLGASYFTQLTIPSLSVTLTSASATYSTGAGYSQWEWTGGQTPTSGTYTVSIS